jgi:catechol 2,3-dioxygenase-like lactoylglutathione lyase family enzyme
MRIHHVALRCPNLNVTRAFYEGVLGMVAVRETPGYSVWLGLGDAVLMLEQANSGEPAPDPKSMRMLAFTVEDAPADLRQRLEEAGTQIEEETEFTYYFRDPDRRRLGASNYPLLAQALDGEGRAAS